MKKIAARDSSLVVLIMVMLMTTLAAFSQETRVFKLMTPAMHDDTLRIAFLYHAETDPPKGWDLFVKHPADSDFVDQNLLSRTKTHFKVVDIKRIDGTVEPFDPTLNYLFASEITEPPFEPWGFLSDTVEYIYFTPDEHLHIGNSIPDSMIDVNTTFKVIVWKYHVTLSSVSDNGADVEETLYFTNHPDSSRLSWKKRIVDANMYYRHKYVNKHRNWIDNNSEQVSEVRERTAWRLIYRLKSGGTPLVTLINKHGRVTETWNYNIKQSRPRNIFGEQ
jgi:hypothetical protein